MGNVLSFIFVLNIFIAAAYCMQCLTNQLSKKMSVTQQQSLLYSRAIFLFSIAIFIVSKIIGSHLNGIFLNVNIPQFAQHFSAIGFAHHSASLQATEPYATTKLAHANYWQYFLFIPIVLIGATSYVKQLYQLRKLIKSSLYQKRFGRIYLLYSNTIQ